MGEPQIWRFSLDFLPPSVNKIYGMSQRTGKPFLTGYANGLKEQIRDAARRAGLQPDKRHKYAVIAVFRMHEWGHLDVDNGLKVLIDAALSSRTDHRVVHLLVDKRVIPERSVRTDVEIWRITDKGTLVDWLRAVLAREEEA